MFKITEFSKIAHVSRRLLQYYDEIDLFKPAYTHPDSGYRYYSVEQLPRLHRILALKDLGLSLDQVARLADDHISPDEIRGMLTLKKAQIEQTLREEAIRLHNVEMRLHQLQEYGTLSSYDVVLKDVPPQDFLSLRKRNSSTEAFHDFFYGVLGFAKQDAFLKTCSPYVALTHSEAHEQDDIDIELGFVVDKKPPSRELVVHDFGPLVPTTLGGVELMAALMVTGEQGFTGFEAIGAWIEANDYQIVGDNRELYWKIEAPAGKTPTETVLEIQFSVEPRK